MTNCHIIIVLNIVHIVKCKRQTVKGVPNKLIIFRFPSFCLLEHTHFHSRQSNLGCHWNLRAGRAYKALCFWQMVESPPCLFHSWNISFHHFLRRNDTGCHLVIFQCGQCFQFCKMSIRHHHLSGIIETKDHMEVVVVQLSQRFLHAQYHWLPYHRFQLHLFLPCSCFWYEFSS